jgi:nucleoid DNA-binding protein
MSLSDLARELATDLGVTQQKATEALRHVWEGIADALAQTGEVRVGDFGTFETRVRKARRGRNPRTGEKLLIPGRWVVTFRPGKALRDRVEQQPLPPE